MQMIKEPSHHMPLCGKNVLVEPMSQRIKIYQLSNQVTVSTLISRLKKLAQLEDCDKLIFYVKKQEQWMLKKHNCHYEGVIKGFFNGEDAFIYALFLNVERSRTPFSQREEAVLQFVKKRGRVNEDYRIPEGYTVRWAVEADVFEMAKLYDTVFASYPTPMNDPDFIIRMMHDDVYFSVVEKNQQIVSACSADVLPAFNAAELSDCATLPHHRNQRLLSHQVSHLIALLRKMGIESFFSYSRSLSVGMNLVNVRHGFQYGGRMIQNSNIAGSLENMNVWYKLL